MAHTFSIENFLKDQGIKYKKGTGGHELVLDKCPTCGKSNKLYVSANKGSFICFHCVTSDPKMRGGPISLVMLVADIGFREAKKIVEGAEDIDIKIQDDEISSMLNLKLDSYSFHKGKTHAASESIKLIPLNLPRYFVPLSKDVFPEAYLYLKDRGISDKVIKSLDIFISAIDTPWEAAEVVGDKLNEQEKKKLVSIVFEIFKERLDINETNTRLKLKKYRLPESLSLKLADAIQSVKYKKRIIFVVRGLDDNVYGWVARDYSEQAMLKVLNSQGTFKNTFMWNFDKVTESKEIVIAEGIISAIKCGIHRGVATLGKMVTESQIHLLKESSADTAYICLDPDAQAEAFELKQRILPIFKNVFNISLPPIKIVKCPRCKQKIEVDETIKIKNIDCPHCSKEILKDDLIGLVLDADYKDAGDYNEEEMQEFINESKKQDKDSFLLKERVLK